MSVFDTDMYVHHYTILNTIFLSLDTMLACAILFHAHYIVIVEQKKHVKSSVELKNRHRQDWNTNTISTAGPRLHETTATPTGMALEVPGTMPMTPYPPSPSHESSPRSWAKYSWDIKASASSPPTIPMPEASYAANMLQNPNPYVNSDVSMIAKPPMTLATPSPTPGGAGFANVQHGLRGSYRTGAFFGADDSSVKFLSYNDAWDKVYEEMVNSNARFSSSPNREFHTNQV